MGGGSLTTSRASGNRNDRPAVARCGPMRESQTTLSAESLPTAVDRSRAISAASTRARATLVNGLSFARVPGENQRRVFGLHLQAERRRGKPDTLNRSPRGNAIGKRSWRKLGNQCQLGAAQQAWNVVKRQPRHQRTGEPIEPIEPLPTRHSEPHERKEQCIRTQRRVGHSVLARRRMPLDHRSMHGIRFRDRQSDACIAYTQGGDPSLGCPRLEPRNSKRARRLLQQCPFDRRQGSQAHWTPLYRARLHHRCERVLRDARIGVEHHTVHKRAGVHCPGHIDTGATAMLASRDRDRFEQHAVRDLARPAIEIVDAMRTRVVPEHVDLPLGSDCESPRLRVVTARRPAREIEDFLGDRHAWPDSNLRVIVAQAGAARWSPGFSAADFGSPTVATSGRACCDTRRTGRRAAQRRRRLSAAEA